MSTMPPYIWKPTHYSVSDGSVAAIVSFNKDRITLENEEGTVFSDFRVYWRPLEDRVQDPVTLDQERTARLMDALEEVHHQWQTYREATDPVTQAHRLTQVDAAISDLATYHPSYDLDTGTLGWERDDA